MFLLYSVASSLSHEQIWLPVLKKQIFPLPKLEYSEVELVSEVKEVPCHLKKYTPVLDHKQSVIVQSLSAWN